MPVGSLGMGSGLDLDSLVKKMVSAQKDPKVKLYQDQIHRYDAKLSALGTVGASIDKFKSSVEKLNNRESFEGRNTQIDQPEDKKVLNVTAGPTASNSSYEISVNQTAKGSRVISKPNIFHSESDVVTARGGKLTFSAGKDSFSVDVDPGTTLAQLRKKIDNAKDNFGVSANIIDDGKGHLFFTVTSDKEGDKNSISITNTKAPLGKLPISDTLTKDGKDTLEKPPVNSDGLSLDSVSTSGLSAGMVMLQGDQARDAMITVDGIQIRNDSNKFDKAVSGLTIDALALTDKPTKVDVTQDEKSVKDTIQGFVSSYNELIGVLKKSTAKGAVLNSNSMIRNLQSSLTNSLMMTHAGPGKLNNIFDLGVKIDNDGTLSLDQNKLDKVMSTSYDELPGLFTGNGGLAKHLEKVLDNYTGIDGMNTTLKNSIEKSKDDTEETMKNFERRMKSYESSLRDKFTHLDSRLSEMKAQGNYLNNTLEKMK